MTITKGRWLVLLSSHIAAAGIGFAAGIYLLPILAAPPAPAAADVAVVANSAHHRGEFRRDLAGSDALHWGEGSVTISAKAVALNGRLAPGPAYKLYLAPEWVETESDFLRVKPQAAVVGDIKTFDNFIVPVPPDVDVERYTTVVVWCEAFSQFITAARYR
jgi:hypothetical protein